MILQFFRSWAFISFQRLALKNSFFYKSNLPNLHLCESINNKKAVRIYQGKNLFC